MISGRTSARIFEPLIVQAVDPVATNILIQRKGAASFSIHVRGQNAVTIEEDILRHESGSVNATVPYFGAIASIVTGSTRDSLPA
jgi:hypothetical protein